MLSVSTSKPISETETISIGVWDESGLLTTQGLQESFVDIGTFEQGKELLESKDIEYFVHVPSALATSIDLYSLQGSSNSASVESQIRGELLESAGIAIAEPNLIATASGALTFRHLVDVGDGFSASPVPSVALLLFVVLLLSLSSVVGSLGMNALVEEKENKVLEVLLLEVKPRTFLLAKMFALLIVGVVQALLFAVPFVLSLIFLRDQLGLQEFFSSDVEPLRWLVGASFAISGMVLMMAILIAVGAFVATAKEASPFFSGLIILLFLPMAIAQPILNGSISSWMYWLIYFPITAPVGGILLNAAGPMPFVEVIGILAGILALTSIALLVAIRRFSRKNDQF